ncbi:MAG: Transposase [Gammaproteobacteria bacterium]|jgi:transposase|nr:Transposase [Gammaproteobacteria bacterium]
MGYIGQRTQAMVKHYGRNLEIVKRPSKWYRVPEAVEDVNSYLLSCGIKLMEGFQVLPKRWIVERTFAWLNKYRRLSKDYEYLVETSVSTFLVYF